MTDKDRIDSLMQLANFRLDRWKSRSDTEWKMSLAFWGLLVGATIKLSAVNLGLWIPAIVAFGYIILWVIPIWVRNFDDHVEAQRFIKQAEKVLTGAPTSPPTPEERIRMVPWATIFQAITTIALVFYAWWVISKN
jgi:hypothetical protein